MFRVSFLLFCGTFTVLFAHVQLAHVDSKNGETIVGEGFLGWSFESADKNNEANLFLTNELIVWHHFHEKTNVFIGMRLDESEKAKNGPKLSSLAVHCSSDGVLDFVGDGFIIVKL